MARGVRSSDRSTEMEGFRSRQELVADARQGAAAARLLDADPGKGRVEIVAAVHEPGAGIDAIADGDCRLLVHGPDRRGQAERVRSEEHTSELQSLMRNSYAVFCL